jgi:hypothetical protein
MFSNHQKIQNTLLKQLDIKVACILQSICYLIDELCHQLRKSQAMNNIIRTAKQMLNAMAFANVENMLAFEKLMNQTSRRVERIHISNNETRDSELNLKMARQSRANPQFKPNNTIVHNAA